MGWWDMPKVVFSSTTDAVDGNARLVTGDAVAEITRLKADDGGPMDIGGATLAAAAMVAGLIDEYAYRHPPGPGRRRHAVLHGPGQLGEPEPGGERDVPSRRAPDQVRDRGVMRCPSRGAKAQVAHPLFPGTGPRRRRPVIARCGAVRSSERFPTPWPRWSTSPLGMSGRSGNSVSLATTGLRAHRDGSARPRAADCPRGGGGGRSGALLVLAALVFRGTRWPGRSTA